MPVPASRSRGDLTKTNIDRSESSAAQQCQGSRQFCAVLDFSNISASVVRVHLSVFGTHEEWKSTALRASPTGRQNRVGTSYRRKIVRVIADEKQRMEVNRKTYCCRGQGLEPRSSSILARAGVGITAPSRACPTIRVTNQQQSSPRRATTASLYH